MWMSQKVDNDTRKNVAIDSLNECDSDGGSGGGQKRGVDSTTVCACVCDTTFINLINTLWQSRNTNKSTIEQCITHYSTFDCVPSLLSKSINFYYFIVYIGSEEKTVYTVWRSTSCSLFVSRTASYLYQSRTHKHKHTHSRHTHMLLKTERNWNWDWDWNHDGVTRCAKKLTLTHTKMSQLVDMP